MNIILTRRAFQANLNMMRLDDFQSGVKLFKKPYLKKEHIILWKESQSLTTSGISWKRVGILQ
jgi:hypothetical protein